MVVVVLAVVNCGSVGSCWWWCWWVLVVAALAVVSGDGIIGY